MNGSAERLDALIIGSGFGGAFAADALVNVGMRVALVERGPWRDTTPTRAAGIAQRSPLPHGRHAPTHLVRRVSAPWLPRSGINPHTHGLFDVHLDRAMTVACSSGVGGCSHVYGAVNARPAVPGYWDNRADGLDNAAMAVRCDAAIARMGARPARASDHIPNFFGDVFANDPSFTADAPLAQPAMGFRFELASYRSSNGVLGSVDGSKVTLDALLVAPAMERGLVVLDLHEAVGLGRTGNGQWWVALRDHRSGDYRHLVAPRLLLAAGTLNTLRLLFANRARGTLGAMPALGLGFGGNGDSFAWWSRNDAHADYSIGAPCHGRFALRGGEDGAELLFAGVNGIDDLPLPRALRARLKRDIVVLGVAVEEAGGTATWRDGRFRFHYDLGANPWLARLGSTFATIAKRSGRPVYSLKKFPTTVHPIGGARVDDNPARGVVDGRGEAHGLPGLFVADAAALPGALGSAPSMTIAAWASHVAAGIGGSPSLASEPESTESVA